MNQEQKQMEETPEANGETPETTEQQNADLNDTRSREELLAEVTRLTAEMQELQNRLLRSTADFDNFRKRARQEKEDLSNYATLRLVQEILPVVDNFQLALAAETSDAESLKKGVEMVFRQFESTLEREGVVAMNAVGQPFDPNFHEAVMQVESDEYAPGTVVEELRKGYLLHDKVVRPAMVKVSR
ncbi:nucleotide exchange factor GrpE [Effusibacillus consociatus]|uniref:Protein GrpE n=1 Tax=Effusibacillus consociatus TaxID=1117041 RepID=A0ABV9PWM2_9BACL